jgi:uncharacterized protein YcfJ
MKLNTITILFASTVTVALLNACTGTEAMPSNATQTGAVTGALAGSVIGYNSGSNRGTNAAVGALIGTAVGAGIGNAVDNNNPEPQQTGGWQ